jgi:hypothetical protein
MVKKTPKVFYGFGGKPMSLMGVYRHLKKRRGRAKLLASALVTMNDGQPARIVFVRDRRKKDWPALLSTDTALPEAEVVRLYGKRWDIEVFFRTAQAVPALEKGCQARDFDTLIAHRSIVMMRYLFLALEQRRHDDPRTLGLLFHVCCEEMRDMSFVEALGRILALALDELRYGQGFSEAACEAMAGAILGHAIDFYGLTKPCCQRSQAVAA